MKGWGGLPGLHCIPAAPSTCSPLVAASSPGEAVEKEPPELRTSDYQGKLLLPLKNLSAKCRGGGGWGGGGQAISRVTSGRSMRTSI